MRELGGCFLFFFWSRVGLRVEAGVVVDGDCGLRELGEMVG